MYFQIDVYIYAYSHADFLSRYMDTKWYSISEYPHVYFAFELYGHQTVVPVAYMNIHMYAFSWGVWTPNGVLYMINYMHTCFWVIWTPNGIVYINFHMSTCFWDIWTPHGVLHMKIHMFICCWVIWTPKYRARSSCSCLCGGCWATSQGLLDWFEIDPSATGWLRLVGSLKFKCSPSLLIQSDSCMGGWLRLVGSLKV